MKKVTSILQKNREVVYMIVGEKHPNYLGKHDEPYREKLMEIAHQLGVADHVSFYNNFVDNRTTSLIYWRC